MKTIKWHDKAIFKSVVMSRRHVEIGTCEDSDYGTVELICLPEDEKELIVSFKDGDKKHEFIEFGGMVYAMMNEVPRISRADSESLMATQGRMKAKTAIGIALRIRNSMANSFTHPGNETLLLVGKTLYRKFGTHDKLVVNTCGNLMFSYWLSVNIEYDNPNKQSYPCHKSSFERVVKESRKLFNKDKPLPGSPKLGGMADHVSFTYPTSVKWGPKYNH